MYGQSYMLHGVSHLVHGIILGKKKMLQSSSPVSCARSANHAAISDLINKYILVYKGTRSSPLFVQEQEKARILNYLLSHSIIISKIVYPLLFTIIIISSEEKKLFIYYNNIYHLQHNYRHAGTHALSHLLYTS